jgi:peroxiredoxin
MFSLSLGAESLNNHSGFKLKLNISPSREGEVAYLLRYWAGDTYIQDSVLVSNRGTALFEAEERRQEGQYLIYIKPDIKLELLLGDEQDNIAIFVDEKDIMRSNVTGSRDTELFWQYLLYLDKNMEEELVLNDKLAKENLSEKERKKLLAEKAQLAKKLDSYIRTQVESHKDTWFSAFVKGTMSQDLPVNNPQTYEDFEKNRSYLVMHYFDNIDLSDPRFWYTNYLVSYLDDYMSSIVDQVPDSLAAAASRIVSKTVDNDFCFEQMLSRLTNQSLQNNAMGVENVWMRLYEDYIRDKGIKWITDAQLRDLDRMYVQAEYNRIGMKAMDIQLQTLDGKTVNMYDIDADYLLLYFYSPTCGYCETEVPHIYNDVYLKYKDKGLKVMTVDVGDEADLWRSFVEKAKIQDWINCADPEFKSKFWIYYDTSGTPATFLLDKNKNIIARKVDKEGLLKILNYYIEQ